MVVVLLSFKLSFKQIEKSGIAVLLKKAVMPKIGKVSSRKYFLCLYLLRSKANTIK